MQLEQPLPWNEGTLILLSYRDYALERVKPGQYAFVLHRPDSLTPELLDSYRIQADVTVDTVDDETAWLIHDGEWLGWWKLEGGKP